MTIRVFLIVHTKRRWIPFDENLFYRIVDKVDDTLVADAFEINDEIVPKKTGTLKESFGTQKEDAGRLMRFFWTAPYAQFVNDGVPSSPGRYVSVIERRLVNPSKRNPDIGMHPGFEGKHFIEEFADIIKARAREVLFLAIEELVRKE